MAEQKKSVVHGQMVDFSALKIVKIILADVLAEMEIFLHRKIAQRSPRNKMVRS